MKVMAFAIAAMMILMGCMNGSEEDSASGGPGRVDGLPQLYTELDSIVVNQLDYLYFTAKSQEPPLAFSEEAKALLTADTLLFQRDSVYDYNESTPFGFPFLRTKFNPKGWFAFYDDINALVCSSSQGEPKGDWLLFQEFEDGYNTVCRRAPFGSPKTTQLWVMHYRDKGFVFEPSTGIGGRDLGKARVYYWK